MDQPRLAGRNPLLPRMAHRPFAWYRHTLDERGGTDLRRAVEFVLALEREFESIRGCLRMALFSGGRIMRTTPDPYWVRLSGRLALRVGPLSTAWPRPFVVDSTAV